MADGKTEIGSAQVDGKGEAVLSCFAPAARARPYVALDRLIPGPSPEVQRTDVQEKGVFLL